MSINFEINNFVIRRLIIGIKTTAIVASFIVMINFFSQITDYNNPSANLANIITITIAWLVVSLLIARSISLSLIDENLSDTAFLFFYILIIAPTTQLAFQLYKLTNDGLVDILPFILLVLIINLSLIPLILRIINPSTTVKSKQKTALFIAVIYCAAITFAISFTSSV